MTDLSISDAGRDLLLTGFRADTPEEAYTKWAATYDADSFEALGFSSPRLCAQVAAERLKEGDHVLDMGCGTGALAALLKKEHGLHKLHMDGSDLTQAMLDVAKQNGLYEGLQRLDLSKTPWPYASKHYDVVLCNGVLIYVQENLDAVLEEFCRVLKPGGHAVLMIREDDVQKWQPSMEKMQDAWDMTFQTEPRDNFENASGFNSESDDGKVWYRIKVFTKKSDM